MRVSHRTIATALALLTTAPGVAADFGTLTQTGEPPIALTHAATCAPRYDFGFGKQELVLLFSDRALDPAPIRAGVDCDSHAFRQAVKVGDGALLRLSFDPGLKLARASIYGVGFTLGDDPCEGCKAAVAYTGENVKGTVVSAKPLDLSSSSFTFDVRFDLPKPGAPPSGTALPAGGGDPGKALAAWVKAYQDGDYATLVKVLPVGEAEDDWGYYEDGPERVQAIQRDGEMEPKTAKVLQGWQAGDFALLVVEVPALWGGDRQKAAVGLSKVDGSWRVDDLRRDLAGTMFGK